MKVGAAGSVSVMGVDVEETTFASDIAEANDGPRVAEFAVLSATVVFEDDTPEDCELERQPLYPAKSTFHTKLSGFYVNTPSRRLLVENPYRV